MTSAELDNLVQAGQLKRESPSPTEIAALRRSGEARLVDAQNEALSLDSRFDLAYNAAHALSLAALRLAGYRSENRYIVFQSLTHSLGLAPSVWRILAKCHSLRNQVEYEGVSEWDERLVRDLITAAKAVRDALPGAP